MKTLKHESLLYFFRPSASNWLVPKMLSTQRSQQENKGLWAVLSEILFFLLGKPIYIIAFLDFFEGNARHMHELKHGLKGY